MASRSAGDTSFEMPVSAPSRGMRFIDDEYDEYRYMPKVRKVSAPSRGMRFIDRIKVRRK